MTILWCFDLKEYNRIGISMHYLTVAIIAFKKIIKHFLAIINILKLYIMYLIFHYKCDDSFHFESRKNESKIPI